MDHSRKVTAACLSAALVVGAIVAASACGSSPDSLGLGDALGSPGGAWNFGGGPKTVLDDRVVDNSEALRTASLKLVSRLPTLEQIRRVAGASNPQTAYEN